MPAELEVPPAGETPAEETAPGPEVTPEGGEPAPQPAEGADEGQTGRGIEAVIKRAREGGFGDNDADHLRRVDGYEAELKAARAELDTAKAADPVGKLAERYLREECGTNADLAAQHRRWIAEAPGGAGDYIDAIMAQRGKGQAAGEPAEETEEQIRTRLIAAEVTKQMAPARARQEKADISATFTSSLDAALQGMTVQSDVAAEVRERMLGDMQAWLRSGVPTFPAFLGLPGDPKMPDLVQARATKLQSLVDAVQAGKKAPPRALPQAGTPPPRAAPPAADAEEKSIDEDMDDVVRELAAESEAASGAR